MSTAIAGPAWIGQRHMEAEKAPSSLDVLREQELEQELVATHLRRVFLLIYRIVGNAADAQDLAQDTFVKALGRRDQLKDRDKAAQWLGRIAYNTAIDFVRQRKRVSFTELESIPEPGHRESPERLALRNEKQAYLADGMRLLSEKERAALILRDVEGLPAAEVAAQLGCSMATVRSHIANARTKFRKYFKGRKE
jgi:RNA polymerase sigma-70 factor (ECF subfamily)